MSAPTPAPTDSTDLWTGGPLPAPGGRLTLHGRPVVLVATRPRTAHGVPIMYRELHP